MKRLFFALFVLFNASCAMDEKSGGAAAADGHRAGGQRWNGEYYQQHSSPQVQGALDTIVDLPLRDFREILDVGCGSGDITAEIARRTPQATVVGIDLSAAMIETAQTNNRLLRNVMFGVADGEQLACPEEFDFVLSFAALHWMANQGKALAGMQQALRPRGRLCISMAGKFDDAHPMMQTMRTIEAQKAGLMGKPSEQYYPRTCEELRGMLTHAGFENIAINEEVRERKFDTPDAFTDWLMGFAGGLPALAALPDAERRAFMLEVAQYYDSISIRDADAKIVYALPVLIASATKG